MSKAEQANEPTMEEILASIRRIISDDDQESGAAAAALGENPQVEDDGEPQAAADDMDTDEEEGSTMAGSPAETEMEELEAGAAPSEQDVLELTDEVAEPEAASGAEEGEEASEESEADIVFLEKTEDEMDAEFSAEGTAADTGGERPDIARSVGGLLSSQADSSVASAFSSLENFVLSTHSRTLEDLVQDMLKPMLKEWLDANLPPLVERLVREEIERVSRGRR